MNTNEARGMCSDRYGGYPEFRMYLECIDATKQSLCRHVQDFYLLISCWNHLLDSMRRVLASFSMSIQLYPIFSSVHFQSIVVPKAP